MTIGAKLIRGSTAPAAYGLNNGATAKLPPLAEGESLQLRCRYAKPLINETTAPVATAWEGPYLRLYTSVNMETLRGVTARVWTGAESISDWDNSDITLPDKKTDPYYEIDACGVPFITAPYDLQPELYSDLSGTWIYDWTVFKRPRSYKGDNGAEYTARQPLANARLFPQTRLVCGQDVDLQPLTRTLDVPLGCVEIEPIGTTDTTSTPILLMGETDVSLGLGRASYPLYDANSLNAGFHRLPVGGARKVIISAGNGGAVSGVVFWCAL